MAEEFHDGICGGNWWLNSLRSVFVGGGASPCAAVNASDFGNYGTWITDSVDLKSRSAACSGESIVDDIIGITSNNNNCISSTGSQSHGPTADSEGGGGGSSSVILMDSTLQMMGFGISSSSSSSPDWSQNLLESGRTESYNSMLQEDHMNSSPGLNSSTHHQIQKDWSPKSFTSSGSVEDLSINNAFKALNHHQDFSPYQLRRPSPGTDLNSAAAIQGFSRGFPSYSNHPSSVIQALFESDDDPPQQPFFNYGTNNSLNELPLSSSWPNDNKPSPPPFLIKPPSLTKQLQPLTSPTGGLHFSNNTPFWNASEATAMMNDVRASFLPSSNQPQFIVPNFEEKPRCDSLATKAKNEDVRDTRAVAKKASETAYKRPRIETPSPLPTFKVRKEKLGDRITALQQLVSPFGKTDTASVLHEAIEYIKFLHEQVSVLSTPYLKNVNPIQQAADKLKGPEGLKQDLRSRGLCLVPISSTFPVANETTADFWTPTFGCTLR